MSFYNIPSLSGADLKKAVASAKRCQDAVLLIYQTGNPYSPSQVFRAMEKAGLKYPLGSARRAITDLTDAGKLVHTGQKITGMFGSSEGVWQLSNNDLNKTV